VEDQLTAEVDGFNPKKLGVEKPTYLMFYSSKALKNFHIRRKKMSLFGHNGVKSFSEK
jgi:hypothetical protein